MATSPKSRLRCDAIQRVRRALGWRRDRLRFSRCQNTAACAIADIACRDSAVDEQAVKRSKQRHRASRDAGELLQAMRQRFTTASALELLAGDRTPQLVDHLGRLAGNVVYRAFQVLGPEP